MKKGIILFAALFLLSSVAAFAKVTAVKEGDVVKVTWTYDNADAAYVGLVGDFQGWNLGGSVPMVKGADGIWSLTLDLKIDGEVKYKFNVDDEWTEDPEMPAGVDDGFGGTNGYVVVAELLAAPGSAPVARGLVVAYYHVSQFVTNFLTENAVDKTVKGLALGSVGLSNKSYFGWDGYLFKDLLKVNGEIRLFNSTGAKMVTLYKQEGVYDAVEDGFILQETVSVADGMKNLAELPWTLLTGINTEDDDNWPAIKGKIKFTLELKDLNLNIAHSAGWMKPSKIEIDDTFVRLFGDPDANDGITEFYNPNAVELDGVSLNYIAQLDKSGSNYKGLLSTKADLGSLDVSYFAVYDSASSDVFTLFEAGNLKTGLGVAYDLGAIDVKAQGIFQLNTDASEIEDPYLVGAGVAFADMGITSSLDFVYGPGEMDLSDSDGDSYNTKTVTTVKLAYKVDDTMTYGLKNVLLTSKDFSLLTSDELELYANLNVGMKIDPSVVLNIPVAEGAEFSVSYVNVKVSADALTSELRYKPNTDFTSNQVISLTTYKLDADSSVGFGLGLLLDENDNNNLFGTTLTYSLKTPFEAIKSPIFFAGLDYNMSKVYEASDEDTVFQDEIADVGVGSGATFRTGLKFSF